MSNITFEKTDNAYTPVTFSRGRTLDSGGYYEDNQSVTENGAGNVQVCDIGVSRQYITCNVDNITPAVYNNLVNFFKDDTVRWKGKTFTFIDEDETEYTVRYWGERLEEIPMKSGNINIQLLLRVE